MTISINKRLVRALMVLIGATHAFVYIQPQSTGNAVLLPKGRADTAHVDARQLPAGAVFELDEEKRFVLHAASATDLDIIPLGLNVHPPGREHSECGIYFSGQRGTDRYVPLQGQQTSDDMCDDVKAIGLVKEPGPRPRLIAIADAYNVHGTYHDQPFTLRWNAGANTYEVDRSLSAILARQKGSSSIADVRALLSPQHH